MTAKEQLLERAPRWTEAQAQRALLAAEGIGGQWGDLSFQVDEAAARVMRDLDDEERAAGLGPWPGAPARRS